MKKRVLLGILGLALIAGSGPAGADKGKSGPDRAYEDLLSGRTAGIQGQGFIGVEGEEGDSNTFYGQGAGNDTMTGLANAFFGRAAGRENTTGADNAFFGRFAGRFNAGGSRNVFVGSSAGRSNVGGRDNVFVGTAAGTTNTSGRFNTFIGTGAGASNVGGTYNTFVGYWAGFLNQSGVENTYLGDEAGYSNVTGTGNVFLGNMAGRNETGSNKLYIDNDEDAYPLIYGEFNNKNLCLNAFVRIRKSTEVMNPTHLLDVGASGAYCNGGAWVDGSSREYKENIEALTSAEAQRAFEKLEPVKFKYREDADETYLGFIAEDVPDLVAMNDRKGLNPMDMVAMLTKVVQEQQKAIAALQGEVAALKEAARKDR